MFKQTYTSKIVIPVGGKDPAKDALEWVFFQEFGTAGRQDAAAAEFGLPRSTKNKYLIVPKGRNKATGEPLKYLSFPDPEGKYGGKTNSSRLSKFFKNRVFLRSVWHPGIKPRKFLRNSLKPIAKQIRLEIPGQGLIDELNKNKSNDASIAFKNAALRTMIAIKRVIVNNMYVVFKPNERIDGKLRGQHPAAVFQREAKIVVFKGKSPEETTFLYSPSQLKTREVRAAAREKAAKVRAARKLRDKKRNEALKRKLKAKKKADRLKKAAARKSAKLKAKKKVTGRKQKRVLKTKKRAVKAKKIITKTKKIKNLNKIKVNNEMIVAVVKERYGEAIARNVEQLLNDPTQGLLARARLENLFRTDAKILKLFKGRKHI